MNAYERLKHFDFLKEARANNDMASMRFWAGLPVWEQRIAAHAVNRAIVGG